MDGDIVRTESGRNNRLAKVPIMTKEKQFNNKGVVLYRAQRKNKYIIS
jgi:hypothetical protein